MYGEPSKIARDSGRRVGIEAATMPMLSSQAVRIVMLTLS